MTRSYRDYLKPNNRPDGTPRWPIRDDDLAGFYARRDDGRAVPVRGRGM